MRNVGLILFILISITLFGESVIPVVEKGKINLTNSDLSINEGIDLKGEWEFYWEKFILPNEKTDKTYIAIPGTWTSRTNKYKYDGYASYRILAKVNKKYESQILSLKIDDICTSYEVYVNGEKIGESGIVSSSKIYSQPKYLPQLVFFRAKSENEIIFYVSNYHNRVAGIWGNIKLGTSKHMMKMREIKLAFEIFLVGSILIMALYHFGIFILQRKKKIFLIFGIFCLDVSFRILLTGERFINMVFQDINWEILFKLEFLTFVFGSAMFLLFIRTLFHQTRERWISYFFYITTGLFALLVIFTNAIVYTRLQQIFQIISLFIVGYAIYLIIISLIKKEEGSIIFFFGSTVLFFTYVNDILYSNQIIHTAMLSPIGFLFFIFSQAFFLSIKFAKDYGIIENLLQVNEKLNLELENKVKERTIQLEYANSALKERAAVKERFLLNMSHEIRTPLNGIIGMTDVLAYSDMNNSQRKSLDVIKKVSGELLGIVNNIMDYSKAKSGNVQIINKPVNIREFFSTIKNFFLVEIKADVEFIFCISKDVPEIVKTDEFRLTQIMINLIGNAVKFTEKGCITVLVKRIALENGKTQLVISVVDTGIGIPSNKIPHLFKSFMQVDETITRKYGGTGLGLAIIKEFIDLMGGQIEVISEVGKGSCFNVQIIVNVEKENDDEIINKKTLVYFINSTGQNKIIKEFFYDYGIECIIENNIKNCIMKYSNNIENSKYLFLINENVFDDETLEETLNDINIISAEKIMVKRVINEDENFEGIGIKYFLDKPFELYEVIKYMNKDDSILYENNNYRTKKDKIDILTKEINLLVIEDNETNMETIKKMLEILDVGFSSASNGEEALNIIAKEKFDIVMTDIQLPDISGFDILNIIRTSENINIRNLPVIAITAHALENYKELCLNAGFNGYLAKPFTILELKKIITDILGEIFQVSAIEDLLMEKEILGNISNIFLANFELYIIRMKEFLKLSDSKSLRFQAHKLKGAAGNIKRYDIMNKCELIETNSANIDIAAIEDAIKYLEIEFCKMKEETKNENTVN